MRTTTSRCSTPSVATHYSPVNNIILLGNCYHQRRKFHKLSGPHRLSPRRSLGKASSSLQAAATGDISQQNLRLYLDSAAVQEWEKWAETDLFYGYTTNPTILRRDGVHCTIPSLQQLGTHAFQLGARELQLQAWGRSTPELASVGRALYAIDERVVVKLPITLEGVKAAKVLHGEGIPITLTGVYAPHQVVTAIACGVSYAAPYLGRMNDTGLQGMEAIIKMQDMIGPDPEGSGLRLLVASIRNPQEIADLAAQGCNTFTFSPSIAQMLFEENLTISAAEVFRIMH